MDFDEIRALGQEAGVLAYVVEILWMAPADDEAPMNVELHGWDFVIPEEPLVDGMLDV
jgi:hypothetical protein